MKRFVSLLAAVSITLTTIPSAYGLMMNTVLSKDSKLYKSLSTRNMQMTKTKDKSMMKEHLKGDVMSMIKNRMVKVRHTARTIREAKNNQDSKRPKRVYKLQEYFIPKSSSSMSSTNSSAASSSSASSTSSH